jgi:hypothetical protein
MLCLLLPIYWKEQKENFNGSMFILQLLKQIIMGYYQKEKYCQKLLKYLNWKQNKGVTEIHLDCDATTYEAATRENCIIKALNFNLLTNQIRGTSYSVAKTWPLAKVGLRMKESYPSRCE